jgi:hypothetical protein
MRVWFERLRKAGEQINQFIFRARPRCIWLSGINSPKGFLTAFRIENANKKGWTIEETILSIELSRYENESQIKEKEIPSELLYISGCNLEGATWFSKENRLMELSPRLLQSTCPLLSVTAAHSRCTQFQNTALFCFSTLTRLCSTIEPKGYSTFPCPLYTCTSIAGPQEFVTYVQIPIADEPMSKWVLRGVRLTCAQFS